MKVFSPVFVLAGLLAVCLCGCARSKNDGAASSSQVHARSCTVRAVGLRMRYISGPLTMRNVAAPIDGGKGGEVGGWLFDEVRRLSCETGVLYIVDAKRMLELQEQYSEFRNGKCQWRSEFALEWVLHPEWTAILDIEMEAGYGYVSEEGTAEKLIAAICTGKWELKDVTGNVRDSQSFAHEQAVACGTGNEEEAFTPQGLAEDMARNVARDLYTRMAGALPREAPTLDSAHPLARLLSVGAWTDAQEELAEALGVYETGAGELSDQEAAELYYLQGWLWECRLQGDKALECYARAQRLHADSRFEQAARRLSPE